MKIISIVGPTAVGKTAFALKVAQELLVETDCGGVDLISADSRQIYKGLEIVSGADIPASMPPHISLHGVAKLDPAQEWSVAHFQIMARQIIENARDTNRRVIIVGGTGLYHDHLFTDDTALHVAPNTEVRDKAQTMSVVELQQWAKRTNSHKYELMNDSDRANPRRLVRVIEIGLAQNNAQHGLLVTQHTRLSIGLTDNLESIKQKIHERVRQRFYGGAVEEISALKATHHTPSLPAFSATGVQELLAYQSGEIDEQTCIAQWSLREFQYAKRQLTWWKKKDVQWFSIAQKGWQQKAIENILSF